MNRWARRFLQMDHSHLSPAQRATHTYVIGQPGMGKTRGMESWIMQDIRNGEGVGVIDPHGDLFQRLVFRLAEMPEVWERVIIIDPCDSKWTVCFNPLEGINGVSEERLSLFLTDVMVKIWRLEVSSAPRLIWLLTNTFMALANLNLTLLDLPRFLLESEYRDGLLPRINNERVRLYFEHEFPENKGAVHQWVTPVLNKIGGLLYDTDMSLMFASHSKLDFRQIMDRRCILLVHIPKGILGEGSSALLGAFIVAHLQKAALSRADFRNRPPFFLYLDEFQNYTTDNILDILSESRKYALSLILVHQYLDQLSVDFRSAVLNTTGNLICFRVGYSDAARMAKEIFPSPDFMTTTTRSVRFHRPWDIPMLSLLSQEKPFGWDRLAQEIVSLPPRGFWHRRRGNHTPTQHRTFDMPDPIVTQEEWAKRWAFQDTAGKQYGRLKQELQQELKGQRSNHSRKPRENINSTHSFWSE